MGTKMNIVYDKSNIIDLLESKCPSVVDYINENPESRFSLYYKYLTHSDLPTFGKATQVGKLDDNILYYLTVSEMKNIEQKTGKPFETAHQSNIGLPSQFWEDIEMNNPRENVNENIDKKTINNYANVFLVNEALKFFNKEYTIRVINKLDKRVKQRWSNEKIDVNLSFDHFTEIHLTQAVHGIGLMSDIEFHKLRHHMFKNDLLFLLLEKNRDKKNLFIIPVKNPKFFTLINESNIAWEIYRVKEQERIDRAIALNETKTYETYTRNYQDRWRNLLAEEMMNYSVNENEVFCPLTYISASFNDLGTIFRASHIKSFSDSLVDEKYDINNGLLLVANADALFDKHLITISENKELMFSFLLDQNHKLKSQLMLNQPIFKEILNKKRMMYVEEHRTIFQEKEKLRKNS